MPGNLRRFRTGINVLRVKNVGPEDIWGQGTNSAGRSPSAVKKPGRHSNRTSHDQTAPSLPGRPAGAYRTARTCAYRQIFAERLSTRVITNIRGPEHRPGPWERALQSRCRRTERSTPTPPETRAKAPLPELMARLVLTLVLFIDPARSIQDQRWLERVMGIEPTSSAWEAEVLPLNYTRK